MKVFKLFREVFLNFFFPKICGYCGESFRTGLSNVLCFSCFEKIEPYREPVCERCGITLPERAFEEVFEPRCLDCGEEPTYLDMVHSFGAYQGALREAHHAFKFEGMEHLAALMVGRTVENISTSFWEDVDVLTPVPMSPEKERERGYDPAALLTAEFSKQLNIPVRSVLKKALLTKPQRSLNREERLRNQKGSFVSETLKVGSKVVLVDDVLTTGATLEECAKVLKKAGAQWVGAVVWGRTPRHGSDRAGN